MKTIIYLTTILLFCSSILRASTPFNFLESTFFSVSTSTPSVLYKIDASTNLWTVVGETGTTNLKALAFNNDNNTLYGVDNGILGTINQQTGQFSAYGFTNLGEGAYGEITLNNIEALTYDPFSNLLFAIHSIPGTGEGTNDLFFKIDPATGIIVRDAVFDFKDRRFDYVPIPEILREATSVKDIVGLAFDPITYNLIALHVQNGYSIITKLNKRTGEIEETLYNSLSAISDIAFDEAGDLYATIANNDSNKPNTLVQINVETAREIIINNIDDVTLNFQSLAVTGVDIVPLNNDLALRIDLSPDQQNPFTQGSVVSFDITVFNQGELKVNEVRLSVKINKDNLEVLNLGIDQSNWIRFGDRIYGSFENTIEPGENFTTSFSVELNDDFKGIMTLQSEILLTYNHNITNEIGKYVPLSDIDSNYDDLNNETNVINNIINGGGATVNEDEDDHDLVMFEVQRANNLIFSPCYTVSSEENKPNILFEFNPESEKWTAVGITGGTSIEAIATDPVNDIIYAVDGGTFGIIDSHTGKFTPFGTIGYGGGAYGIIQLDNIKGLTYDPVNEIMYAIHRIKGEGPGTNDVFFQIDVSTGKIIPVAMQDPETDSPIDYVIIPEVFNCTLKKAGFCENYDVDDIAYNPYTGQLFAIQNQLGLPDATITELNLKTGEIESVIYDMRNQNDLEGFGFTSLGELYATQGDMGFTEKYSNNFIKIDLAIAETISLGKIDPDDGIPPAEQVDFEAFDCFTAYNDLALKMEIDPSIQQPVKAGDEITFIIEVFNQGDFANNDISIVNYIPTGLILSDSSWEDLGNGTAIYTYNKSIEPGTSFQVSIGFIVDANFEEESITNTAEIASSFNPLIVDPFGNPIPLPDWDSFPDDQNVEFLVTDNDINGGGPNSIRNQDEDDHDIATIKIGEITPPPYNTLTKFNCYTVSEDNAAPNVLFEFDAFTGKWTEVGVTGGTHIEAIATDPITGIIYATDDGTFGTIDASTALFTPIGEVGSGNGDAGVIELDDVDGLTYDPVNQIMYATHRVGGIGPGTNDLLFQIDVATGKVIPGAMLDANNNPVDYGVIPEIFDGDFGGDLYDIGDIAYNVYTRELLAIGLGAISQLDPLYGQVIAVNFASYNDDIEGLGFNSLGKLYATTGSYGSTLLTSNAFFSINLKMGTTTQLNSIDPTNQYKDFEAFDCFTAFNDLALKIEVEESTEQPALAGQTIDFVITIFNQGDFISSDISLTNYIPNGLELSDALWTDIGNGKATYILNETLEPGATATVNISFKVAEGFEGQTLTNAVEISASFSPIIIDEEGNFYTDPLPDLDSKPDDENNETNVSDNAINGSGPNANQDEDDHDIATIEIAEPAVPPTYNTLTKFKCYTVSEDNAAPNVLFEYNPSTGNWTEVGVTGGTHIEAIATDPITGIIYATDDGIFGTIDATTALFTPIGEIGSGIGEAGLIELDDVDGLTFDPVNQIMYGTHRVGGFGPGTNDLLFQIDVATGKLIPGAMIDSRTGNPVDYAIIPEVFDSTFKRGEKFDLYDVDDIAYNSYTGQLFAMQNQDGPGILTELDPTSGDVVSIIYDVPDDDMEGIGFTYLGELYGTTGDNGSTQLNSNTFIHIDLQASSTTTLSFIDPSGREVDFEAFDCFTAYNDLALLLETESNQLVNTGGEITFLLTIFNQGDFPNNNISITNYIPKGLTLADSNWMDSGDGKATYTFEDILQPGEDHTIKITYTVDSGYEGQTLTNAVEISSSFLPDIIDVLSLYNYPTDLRGNPTALPDWDSQPDNENNETNVVDNEMNGGGLNANQDEDDHDIAVIQVGALSCPEYLVLPSEEISGYHQAQQAIEIQGSVKQSKTATFNICK